jgi:TPR repeat protein
MNSLFKSFVSGKKTDDGDKSTSTPTSATSATPGRSAIDVLRGCDANAEQSGSGKGDDEFNRWLAHANRNLFVDDNVSAVRVARAFEFGEYGVKVDLKKAMFFYKRAINEMSGVEAINEHPTPLSSKLLADAFSAALKRGSKSNATVDDLQRLAYCYHVGQGTAVDIQKACEIYRRILAIDPKILQTLVNLSSAVPKLPESDYVESFELRKRAAELDSPTSMVGVARCLQNGCGVEKDAVAALEWLYRAAFKGYVPAITSLWLAMRDGVGVAKSDAAAFPWCKRAAEAGDPQSCVQLGRYYRAGIGGEQNDAEAARLFYQAAIDGDPDGALDLGRCFEGGHGVEKDVDEAVGWYAIAAVSSPDASNAWSALARVPVPPSQVLVALEVASANKSLKRIHSTAHTLAKVALRAATLDEIGAPSSLRV